MARTAPFPGGAPATSPRHHLYRFELVNKKPSLHSTFSPMIREGASSEATDSCARKERSIDSSHVFQPTTAARSTQRRALSSGRNIRRREISRLKPLFSPRSFVRVSRTHVPSPIRSLEKRLLVFTMPLCFRRGSKLPFLLPTFLFVNTSERACAFALAGSLVG